MAVDHEGYVYVADTGNHAIRMISPLGNVTTLAGTGRPGHKDGLALDGAEFSSPSGIAVWRDWQWWPYPNPIDPNSVLYKNGNGTLVLFVADTANHRIRRVKGTVSYNEADGEKSFINVTVECFAGFCNQRPQAGFSDGTKNEARFDSPLSLAVHNSGDIQGERCCLESCCIIVFFLAYQH